MMDERTIQDLQFETILHELEDLCLSEEGRLSLRTQPFLLDRAQLGERQDLVEDLIALYSFGKETPQPFPPISEALAELRKPGDRKSVV